MINSHGLCAVSLSLTRQGYDKASLRFNSKDLENVDLNGKIIMITGANSGIGKCVATALAKMGAEVHLVCRNPASAEEARKEIMDATGNPVRNVPFILQSSMLVKSHCSA